ncbi:MAG: glycerol-3-phosphate acyltransferase [Anaerolineales bacterium]|nr:glycerol-3-phosphate acyltransferase [Anaerolineales bacterium]
MAMQTVVLVLIGAYLLGSLPTALLVSRAVAGEDIREIGDGNMGARNVARTLGWGPGAFVATVDFCKGALAVIIAWGFDLGVGWQLAAGACAVLGHDFPIWARLRGGQGMAAILGMLFILLPWETVWGLLAFGAVYLVSHHFDFSAGMGLGLLAALTWLNHQPGVLLAFAVGLFISIPAKKALDWPRRRRLRRLAAREHLEEAPPALLGEENGANGYSNQKASHP